MNAPVTAGKPPSIGCSVSRNAAPGVDQAKLSGICEPPDDQHVEQRQRDAHREQPRRGLRRRRASMAEAAENEREAAGIADDAPRARRRGSAGQNRRRAWVLAGRRSVIGRSRESVGGHVRNRTGIHGFAIRCVTTPPRGLNAALFMAGEGFPQG